MNFLTFKKIAFMMSNKEHLTIQGYEKILALYSTMNKNRSFEEKFNFLAEKSFTINKDWLTGFIDAEGTFYCYIEKQVEAPEAIVKKIPKITNTLEIAQSSHELPLLKAIITFLELGYLKPKPKGDDLESIRALRSVSRIVLNSPEKVIKFLGLEPFISLKQKDYILWKNIYELVKLKAHHNVEGLNKILNLKKLSSKKKDKVDKEE